MDVSIPNEVDLRYRTMSRVFAPWLQDGNINVAGTNVNSDEVFRGGLSSHFMEGNSTSWAKKMGPTRKCRINIHLPASNY